MGLDPDLVRAAEALRLSHQRVHQIVDEAVQPARWRRRRLLALCEEVLAGRYSGGPAIFRGFECPSTFAAISLLRVCAE